MERIYNQTNHRRTVQSIIEAKKINKEVFNLTIIRETLIVIILIIIVIRIQIQIQIQ